MTSTNGSETATPAARPGPMYSTRFKVVAALVIVLATGLFTVAYLRISDQSDGTGSGGTREFVEALLPPEGSQALQQSTVGIDLAPGWQGLLRINGQEIPEEQLNGGSGGGNALNTVEFTPGQGKVLETLRSGQTCVQAVVWQSARGREDGQRTVAWCFTVL